MSHRHHLELSDRRLSDALPPFGPLQKRSTAPTFGIIYRAVTHDRTNFGQALKVVTVSLHDISFAVGHRLDEVRARQDHFAQEVGHLCLHGSRAKCYTIFNINTGAVSLPL